MKQVLLAFNVSNKLEGNHYSLKNECFPFTPNEGELVYQNQCDEQNE